VGEGVTRPPGDLRDLVRRRVNSAMTAALRADPAALDEAAARLDADAYLP
jgi:hypothetical protein